MSIARKLTASLSAAVAGLLMLYPLFVYFGFSYFRANGMAAVLIAVCALRLTMFRFTRAQGFGGLEILLVCGGGIVLAAVTVLGKSPNAMLFYPVLVNGALLLLFAWSLACPPTVIERIARSREGDLPPEAVTYTRRVTMVWVGFFVINGAAAIYTALLTSLETWALYNGLVAYVLIGAMLGGELLMRKKVIARLRK